MKSTKLVYEISRIRTSLKTFSRGQIRKCFGICEKYTKSITKLYDKNFNNENTSNSKTTYYHVTRTNGITSKELQSEVGCPHLYLSGVCAIQSTTESVYRESLSYRIF